MPTERRFIKLRGRIIMLFGTLGVFARELEVSRSTLSAKLNGKVDWTGPEIARTCALLDIPLSQAWEYDFF